MPGRIVKGLRGNWGEIGLVPGGDGNGVFLKRSLILGSRSPNSELGRKTKFVRFFLVSPFTTGHMNAHAKPARDESSPLPRTTQPHL